MFHIFAAAKSVMLTVLSQSSADMLKASKNVHCPAEVSQEDNLLIFFSSLKLEQASFSQTIECHVFLTTTCASMKPIEHLYFLQKAHHSLLALRNAGEHLSTEHRQHFKQWNHQPKKPKNAKKEKKILMDQNVQLFASLKAKTRGQSIFFNLNSRSNGSVFVNIVFTVTLESVYTMDKEK